jgi:hypothetical protein
MTVVFPAPLAPIKPTISPDATWMVTLSTTVLAPNDLVTLMALTSMPPLLLPSGAGIATAASALPR